MTRENTIIGTENKIAALQKVVLESGRALASSEAIRMAEKKILIEEIEKNAALKAEVERLKAETWYSSYYQVLARAEAADKELAEVKKHSDMQHEGLRQAIDEIARLEAERRRDAIAGQCALDEANTEIERLKQALARLEQIVQEQKDTIILFEKSHAALRASLSASEARERGLRGKVEKAIEYLDTTNSSKSFPFYPHAVKKIKQIFGESK